MLYIFATDGTSHGATKCILSANLRYRERQITFVWTSKASADVCSLPQSIFVKRITAKLSSTQLLKTDYPTVNVDTYNTGHLAWSLVWTNKTLNRKQMLKLLLTWGMILCVYVTASAALANDILHLSAAWMSDALGSSANNPLPQILNWLLRSQWHKPINKSCCLLRTVILDPKRERKRKKPWQPWLNSRDYPPCWGVENSKNKQHICVKWRTVSVDCPTWMTERISTLYFNCKICNIFFLV